mgnify:CR=1 FL=1
MRVTASRSRAGMSFSSTDQGQLSRRSANTNGSDGQKFGRFRLEETEEEEEAEGGVALHDQPVQQLFSDR